MHSGFSNLRSALPMNIKAHYPGFKSWAGARTDIERITAIWNECLKNYGGPFCSARARAWRTRCMRRCARAFSPTTSSSIRSPPAIASTVMAMPVMQEWIEGAKVEPDELEELDVEF